MASAHEDMPDWVPVYHDIAAWEDGSSWAGCSSGRRLAGEAMLQIGDVPEFEDYIPDDPRSSRSPYMPKRLYQPVTRSGTKNPYKDDPDAGLRKEKVGIVL